VGAMGARESREVEIFGSWKWRVVREECGAGGEVGLRRDVIGSAFFFWRRIYVQREGVVTRGGESDRAAIAAVGDFCRGGREWVASGLAWTFAGRPDAGGYGVFAAVVAFADRGKSGDDAAGGGCAGRTGIHVGAAADAGAGIYDVDQCARLLSCGVRGEWGVDQQERGGGEDVVRERGCAEGFPGF
jgi:hypothetical protein